MKICAIICEFNPFHNGHAYIIDQAKKISACDYIICIMSGQFTQRGDMCRTDKFIRAKHAVNAGADAVIELYTPFAVAPAEIFAKGAIKLLSYIDGDLTLCFGSESGDSVEFMRAAQTLSDESGDFKKCLLDNLDKGFSYSKSYSEAFAFVGGNSTLISTPNNILGVEYCKAILNAPHPIDVVTVQRKTGTSFASAHTIRGYVLKDKIQENMPDYAYSDYAAANDRTSRFEQICADALMLGDKEKLKKVYGCSEGLENRLIKLTYECGGDYTAIVEQATSRRYPAARIKRVLTANLLKLYSDDTQNILNSHLNLKILAVKKQSADAILPILSLSVIPNPNLEKCLALTSSAYATWRYLSAPTDYSNINEKMILV